jgi:catechol 2,3-dioxygenase-like lactoylglutathione lyase family enzyme
MSVQLNHTIVWCRDAVASSVFLADILGLPSPQPFLHFLVVDLANGVSLDYYQTGKPPSPQHYAFLLSEEAFDESFARIQARGLAYWADPARTQPAQINHHFGGRGLYFRDPDDHLLEIITRPYDRAAPPLG